MNLIPSHDNKCNCNRNPGPTVRVSVRGQIYTLGLQLGVTPFYRFGLGLGLELGHALVSVGVSVELWYQRPAEELFFFVRVVCNSTCPVMVSHNCVCPGGIHHELNGFKW